MLSLHQFFFSFLFCSHIQDVADKKKKRLFQFLKTHQCCSSCAGGCQFVLQLPPPCFPLQIPICWLVLTFYRRVFCLVLVDRLCINKKVSAQSAATGPKKRKRKKQPLCPFQLQQIHLGSVMEQEGRFLEGNKNTTSV